MPNYSGSKLKILYLYKFFLENTDEEHSVSMPEIISYLNNQGIHAERKSVYGDIEALRLFGLDIIAERDSGGFAYKLGNRQFELAELKLLVDSVQSARFITEKKSNKLIKKIEGLSSTYEASKLQRQVFVAKRVKTDNESIFYNVDAIHNAIAGNSVITFKYFNWNVNKKQELRRNGELYEVSPWALTLFDENYYLVSFDAADGHIKYFRVDKMLDISLTGKPRLGRNEFESFDVADYTKKRFGMYDGDVTKVRLLVDNSYAGVIIDRFGKDVPMLKADDTHFFTTVTVAVSNQFLGWVASMSDAIRIEGPEEVVARMRDVSEKLFNHYKG